MLDTSHDNERTNCLKFTEIENTVIEILKEVSTLKMLIIL